MFLIEGSGGVENSDADLLRLSIVAGIQQRKMGCLIDYQVVFGPSKTVEELSMTQDVACLLFMDVGRHLLARVILSAPWKLNMTRCVEACQDQLCPL